ncbi:cytochrome P450 [Streptomyces canus]|uniref:cytochrome P450 n=1 Tax=Streptomyces canus TaxID=58343 RepID=UPI0022529EC2|nr:cytochrome P450 [Streptomyces canus]MCX5255525.1 cytochrome P450 [Streptomyces canus]
MNRVSGAAGTRDGDEWVLRRILDAEVRADPYPLYEEVRLAEPVWVRGRPVVVFASYAACGEVLRDPRASNDRRHSLLFRQTGPADGNRTPSPPAELPSFLFMDPPRHTALRRLAAPDFTPRAVRRLTPMIRELIDDLLDEAAARGRLDGVADLASPLPVTVICRVLGIGTGERDWYRTRSSLLGQAVDPYLAFLGAPAPGLARRRQAEAELTEFFSRLAAERRARPRDDMMSRLLAAETDGERLTDEEVVTTCRLLLNAGHETTVSLIANGLLTLLDRPETLAALRDDPGTAAPAVVEEMLRLQPPLQLVHRHAREDMEVRGTPVPRGTTMVLLLAGANRDGAVFGGCPHAFDAARAEGAQHLSFGLGPHYCLGAPLGRLEAELAFTRFAQRVVAPRLTAGPPGYRPHVVLRGPASLPLSTQGIRDRRMPWEAEAPDT